MIPSTLARPGAVTFWLAVASSTLALFSSELARVCTARTAPQPARATSTAAPAAVTPVRCRASQRARVRVHGSLHAEKYYHTATEEFGRTRKAYRWEHLVALARVTASECGRPAPGVAQAQELLKV